MNFGFSRTFIISPRRDDCYFGFSQILFSISIVATLRVPCALCMYLHWRCVHLSAFRFQSLAFIFHVKNCAKCFGRNPLIFNSKNLMFVDSVEIMYVYWRRRHTHVLQRCRRKSFDVNTLSSMCQSVICPFAFSHVTFTSRVHANIVCKHTLHRTDSAAWRSRCWKRHQMPSQN